MHGGATRKSAKGVVVPTVIYGGILPTQLVSTGKVRGMHIIGQLQPLRLVVCLFFKLMLQRILAMDGLHNFFDSLR